MSEENSILLPDPTKLVVSSSPHIREKSRLREVMVKVIFAMLPALFASYYFFGFDAIRVVVLTTLFCVVIEAITLKTLGKDWRIIKDGSAALTGVLLAMNLSANTPWWICLVGAIIAIILAKQLFGGLGYNPFNPALVARVALLVGFPSFLTTWAPTQDMLAKAPDAISTATPLYEVTNALQYGGTIDPSFTTWNYFIGNIPGCLGETSALALLIGGAMLLFWKLIRWQVPVFYLLTVAIITGTVHAVNPDICMSAVDNLFTGGLMLGAIFMATDMVTSPETPKGAIIYAVGCGIITCAIRIWAAYPEGVSFAILFMNALVPLIDRLCATKPFGRKEQEAL